MEVRKRTRSGISTLMTVSDPLKVHAGELDGNSVTLSFELERHETRFNITLNRTESEELVRQLKMFNIGGVRGKPWHANLSAKASNILWRAYTSPHRSKFLHKVNFEELDEDDFKTIVKSDVSNKRLDIKNFPACGDITRKEIEEWCNLLE